MRKAEPGMKGPIMKTGTILAAALALTTAPALAQTQQPAPAPQTQTQQTIQSVSVIDVTELPAESQAQVAQIEKKRTDAELENLHKSIETSPALLAAIEEKGASLDDVVAASLSQDGALTIVTRKNS